MTRISPFARAYGRHRATELMEDRCRILRPGPVSTTYDPVTRKVITVSGVLVYEGACRLWEANTSRTEVNGQLFTVAQPYLSIPWDAPIPEMNDRVEMLDSVDSKLVGRGLIIMSVTRGGGLRVSRRMAARFTDFAEEDK